MAILLGNPTNNDGLNANLCAWYMPIGNPYSGFSTWTDLARLKQATVTAGVTWGRSFALNSLSYPAVTFAAGSSHYASCPVPAGLHGATHASVTMVVRSTGTGNNPFQFATGTTDDYWPFSGAGYFGIFRTARVDAITPLASTEFRDWQHLAITTDGTNWICYQNGQQISSVAAQATVTATKLEIGRSGGPNYTSSSVVSVRVWANRALSPYDVVADYMASKQLYARQFNYTKPGFITTVAAGGASSYYYRLQQQMLTGLAG